MAGKTENTSHNPTRTSTSTKAKTRGNVTITVTTGADRGGGIERMQDSKSPYYVNKGPKSRGEPHKFRYVIGDAASRNKAYAEALKQTRAIFSSERRRASKGK